MNKKIRISLFSVLTATILLTFSLISLGMIIPAADQAIDKARALEKSPVISEGWNLERIDYIHYFKASNSSGKAKDSAGYKLMGVKWQTTPIDYFVNTTGQDTNSVLAAFGAASENWDYYTSKELFNSVHVNNSVQYGIPDGINAIEFDSYSGSNNVIAVTSIWINKSSKQIVEFDMLYNTYYLWGNADETSERIMDMQNIATHELGHAVGLSDIYGTPFSDVTMYGYASYNETSKRSLETPDILGLQKIYGI